MFGGIVLRQDWSPARVGKFRQAGFVYLHVAILYEAAVYAMLEAGTLPTRFGPPVAWLMGGAAVAAFGFVGLYHWAQRLVRPDPVGAEWPSNAFSDRGRLLRFARHPDPSSVLPDRSGRRRHQPLDARACRMGPVIRVEDRRPV